VENPFSFGFKYGIPLDADYVFDVRFLPNPHWDPTLRPMTGLDTPVAEFLKLNVAEKNIWVSYERNMHCGIGKCGHCKMDATYICLDGPVFDYEFAKNLVD